MDSMSMKIKCDIIRLGLQNIDLGRDGGMEHF